MLRYHSFHRQETALPASSLWLFYMFHNLFTADFETSVPWSACTFASSSTPFSYKPCVIESQGSDNPGNFSLTDLLSAASSFTRSSSSSFWIFFIYFSDIRTIHLTQDLPAFRCVSCFGLLSLTATMIPPSTMITVARITAVLST